MPLTPKGEKIKSAMEEQYGPEKGEEVFYASANKGTITGVDNMAKPEDCADSFGGIFDETGLVTQPLPVPEFEHPQLHPDASTPPEPANDGLGGRDAAAGYGGVAGGVVQQGFDSLPTEMSLNDICRGGEQFWKPQWGGTE